MTTVVASYVCAEFYLQSQARRKLGGDLEPVRRLGGLVRRVGVGPKPQKDRASDSEHGDVEQKHRRIGMELVKAKPAEARADADAKRKDAEHRAVDLGVAARTEVAAGEKRHQVDFGADAETQRDRADKAGDRCQPRRAADEYQDADHRQDKKADRNVGTTEP